MLVISRRPNEALLLGADITLKVLSVRGDRVVLGVTAPEDVPILRSEAGPRLNHVRPSVFRDASRTGDAW